MAEKPSTHGNSVRWLVASKPSGLYTHVYITLGDYGEVDREIGRYRADIGRVNLSISNTDRNTSPRSVALAAGWLDLNSGRAFSRLHER